MGCYCGRTEGDHRIWKKKGLLRPIVVRTLKDLPVFEIKNNLRTLGVSTPEYLEKVELV